MVDVVVVGLWVNRYRLFVLLTHTHTHTHISIGQRTLPATLLSQVNTATSRVFSSSRYSLKSKLSLVILTGNGYQFTSFTSVFGSVCGHVIELEISSYRMRQHYLPLLLRVCCGNKFWPIAFIKGGEPSNVNHVRAYILQCNAMPRIALHCTSLIHSLAHSLRLSLFSYCT